MVQRDPTPGRGGVAVWPIEAVVAGLLAVIAVVVMADSARVGIGWAAEGPQAGFFPFWVALILLASAGYTLATALMPALRDRGEFVDAVSLRRVMTMLLPMVAYVVAIRWLGLYLASALLIAGFMRLQGGYGVLRSILVASAIAVVLYAFFELWFLVPMPRGPLEDVLGL